MELPNGQFHVSAMVNPTQYAPIFQTQPDLGQEDILASNKVTLRNFDVQLLFSPKNSLLALTPRIVRVYWLQLKSETAMATLGDTANMTQAGLNSNATGTTAGQLTHITTSNGGLSTMVKFNPSAFRIRYYKEFTLANIVQETAAEDADDDVSITNTGNALRRIRFRVRAGNKLKPPRGTWRQMALADIMPKDQHYLVVHVGGWGGPGIDGDNAIHMNTNITVNTRQTN